MASTASEDPVLSLIYKRHRALGKKYRRIIFTERCVNRGEKINPEQEKLLRSKPAVAARMDELRKLLQPFSDAELSLSLNTRQADENVNPLETHYALGLGQREHFPSSSLFDIGMEVQSGSSIAASSKASSPRGLSPPLRMEPVLQSRSSSPEDIMFVVYSRMSGYIVKAFERSGVQNLDFSFGIDLYATLLPFHCGFGVVGPILYMIGGRIFDKLASTYVSNLVTYKIDLRNIPRFPNKSIPLDFLRFVQVGPRSHAEKQSPIVITVGSKIYVFSRYLKATEKSPKNFECLDTEARGWELLPEPPFRKGESKGRLHFYQIESHVVVNDDVNDDFIVIRITGEGNPGMFKLNLRTHLWISVDTKSVDFSGKGVCYNNVYYAFMDRRINHLENRVVYFRSPFRSEVDEVADIQPYPEEVRWLNQCEFASMGASIFIARTGYSSPPNPDAKDPSHHLTVEKFEVSMVAGKAKAIKKHIKTFKLKISDAIYTPKALYFVSWVRSG